MVERDKRIKNRGSAGNNRKKSEDFFLRNRQKPDVIETESGLQYIILEKGDGDFPDQNATLLIHQRCQVLGGNIIEDTFRENSPSECKMSELIEGYAEGLLKMRKGARFKLFIPPELAWGKKGAGSKIPPMATLIFDVRLIDWW